MTFSFPMPAVIGGGPIPDDIVSFAEDGSKNLFMVQIDGEIHKISVNLPGTYTVIVEGGQIVDGNRLWKPGSADQFHQRPSLGRRQWQRYSGQWRSRIGRRRR